MDENKRCIKFTWQKNDAECIIPIFLPFWGCKNKCVFCAQDTQIGASLARDELDGKLRLLEKQLLTRKQNFSNPAKIGFYGGTFTALEDKLWEKCLNFARKMQKEGLASQFTCSTRPDYLTERRAAELKSAGCCRVELGIQSLDEKALLASGRPYTENDVNNCIQLLNSAGLECGAQLMPGFPFSQTAAFLYDLQKCLNWGIKIFRIYPCVVFENTPLAKFYQNGSYKPLNLEEAAQLTVSALLQTQDHGARIIRMGILMTGKDKSKIVAGPYDESFGSRVMARALLEKIKQAIEDTEISPNFRIYLPYFCQGFFWGWKGELRGEWQQLNINSRNVRYWHNPEIKLVY